METIRSRYLTKHPLITREFKTNGKDLFLQTIDKNENLSQPDQLNFKHIMDTFLQHVVPDEHDLVKKIFPIIAGQPDDRVISITYGVSSSQPVVDGVGVPAWVLRERYSTGEEVESLAADFEITVDQVRRAIDYFEQRVS